MLSHFVGTFIQSHPSATCDYSPGDHSSSRSGHRCCRLIRQAESPMETWNYESRRNPLVSGMVTNLCYDYAGHMDPILDIYIGPHILIILDYLCLPYVYTLMNNLELITIKYCINWLSHLKHIRCTGTSLPVAVSLYIL